MNINTKYDLGQKVYYIHYGSFISEQAKVYEGVIQGFQIKRRKGKLNIGVDFKHINNLPIELVSTDKTKLEEIVKIYNAKTVEERLETIKEENNK